MARTTSTFSCASPDEIIPPDSRLCHWRCATRRIRPSTTLCVTVTEFNDNRDAITDAVIAPDRGAGGACTN